MITLYWRKGNNFIRGEEINSNKNMKEATFRVIGILTINVIHIDGPRCMFIHALYLHSHFSLRCVQFTQLTDETICNKNFFLYTIFLKPLKRLDKKFHVNYIGRDTS